MKSVSTKVSEAEFAMLEQRPRASGLTLSEWARDVLFSAQVDGVPEAGEVVLADLLALRSLFLNLQLRRLGSDDRARDTRFAGNPRREKRC